MFEGFHKFENTYPNIARVQTLVTPRLPHSLGWLRRNPSRVRKARPFYAPFPDIVTASDEALKDQCVQEFGKPLGPFVADFIEISERNILGRDDAVQTFSNELHRTFPILNFHPRNVESAFDALASLARRRLPTPLMRRELEEMLQEHLEQELPFHDAFPLHIRSDRNEPAPFALQIDAKAFSGAPAPYPASEVWASDLIKPLDKTARWLRSHNVSRVALRGSYRLTTALVLGWSLRSAHGFELDVGTRGGIWRTNDRPRAGEAAPDWEIEEPESLCGDQLAVSVGVLRNPATDLPNTADVLRGSVLGFHLATALTSAAEAQASASLIKRTIDKFVARLQPNGIQLYTACPAALAVVLGHRWNAMPPTQLHEYLHAARRYIPTAAVTV
ncbi:MAG: SAVED domain-containing protein [Albidovulum sp.]|nr:SAVED domain-containing protein [Albidovulum sp.]